jgi:hypothetical protein
MNNELQTVNIQLLRSPQDSLRRMPYGRTMNYEQSTTKDYVRNYKLFMQNEPNLCVFWAVNGDYEEKRTQNEPKTNPICEKVK